MFKTVREYDLAMKKILTLVRDSQPIDELITNIDYHDAFIECVRRLFIKGVSYRVDANNEAHIEECKPRITRDGLDFIEYIED